MTGKTLEPAGAEAGELMLSYLEGAASAEEARELSAAMRASPELRRRFAEMTRQHLMLFELAEETVAGIESQGGGALEQPAGDQNGRPKPQGPRLDTPRWHFPRLVWLAAAAAVIAIAAVTLLLRTPGKGTTTSPGVDVEVAEAVAPVVGPGQPALVAGRRVRIKELQMYAGTVKLRLSSGALVSAGSPANLDFLSPMHLRVFGGKVTTDVGEHARGFIIDTASAKVVDLGTVCGVGVSPTGEADIVVFDGRVAVHGPAAAPGSILANLSAGEAIRVDTSGQLQRIPSITTGPGADDWSSNGQPSDKTVIAAVKDNVDDRTRWSYRFYPIMAGGMAEGVRAWPYENNKPYWWSPDGQSLPDWLAGADLVQMLQQELSNRTLEITLTIAQPALVYVFYEAKSPLPEWLERDFVNTGAHLRLSPEPPNAQEVLGRPPTYSVDFTVWRREVTAPGPVRLGAVSKTDVNSPPFYMYGIAAKAATAPGVSATNPPGPQ